ncbi:MAG: ABC transporter permease [Bacteroidales bacterium]|nr:ABC transporter permease [Bacteroidales bacterium]
MDISYPQFFLGFVLLLIPVYFLQYYKTGLVKDTLFAAGRMTGQLFLIGLYLEYLFRLNSSLINLIWVLVMIVITAFTVVKRTNLSLKTVFLPVSMAILLSIILIAGFFLNFVLQLNSMFEARYFIPICGMILGNMLNACVISLSAYYSGIKREKTLYQFSLGNGATPTEAQHYFIRDALIKSLNPTIATMAVMGLIALPGTMTGQILGGSSPSIAIKYQIMIMIVIFAASVISVVITILLSSRNAFSKSGILKK